MAYWGCLNVLANIMGKIYVQIFNEFEGIVVLDFSFGDGDVKYYFGFFLQVEMFFGKNVYLKLVFNFFYLEFVDLVVEGFVCVKADILYNSDYDQILFIFIYGDVVLVGQGVIYEIVQMSKLVGYYIGGIIYFVINN